MAQYSPLFVAVNALLFAMWAAAFCCTLTRRFSMPVTILGFVVQYFIWVIPPYFMAYGSILRVVYPLIAIVLPLFLLFCDKWQRILFVALSCLVFMYVADLVPCAIIFTPEQMHAGLALQPLPQRLAAYAICVSLDAFLLWMLVLFMNRYKNRLHGSEWALYMLFPLSQYLLLFGWLRVCLTEMTLPRTGYVIAAMLCLERILRRTKLTLLGGITEWTALPPAELLDAEAAQQFIRCHQSYWVNFRQIETMENDCVLLPGGLRVPISRTYRSTAREQFFSRLQI